MLCTRPRQPTSCTGAASWLRAGFALRLSGLATSAESALPAVDPAPEEAAPGTNRSSLLSRLRRFRSRGYLQNTHTKHTRVPAMHTYNAPRWHPQCTRTNQRCSGKKDVHQGSLPASSVTGTNQNWSLLKL